VLVSSADRDDDTRSAAEKVIRRSFIDETGVGKRLSERARTRERSLEAYLRGEMLPRYIRRLADIERQIREHERALRDVHDRLHDIHAGDPQAFAREWRAIAGGWDFGQTNALIAEHNEWYPVERDLPMSPRTRDYVLVNGRPYRRDELDADWVLRQFPVRLRH
jgi:hypothetical protein